MADAIDRRTALTIGGAAAAAAAGGLPAVAATFKPAGGVVLFDASSREVRGMAEAVRGQRLLALDQDPVRMWRTHLAGRRSPVRGLTRWSDYLVLRGMAEEEGLRLVAEARVATAGGPMIVDWSMA